MHKRARPLPVEFIRAISDAAQLLDRARSMDGARPLPAAEPLPSLLEQCKQLVSEAAAMEPEPIRTVHHFACTGGTLIAKCLASMPNTQVLSEVDPLSELGHSTRGKFLPTDLVGLVRSGTREVDDALLVDIFLRGLGAVYDDAQRKGIRLILRDHAHSRFCFGGDVQDRPSLREIVARDFNVRSVVTVRHPLDSYLSLRNNDWLHFQPNSLDEYSRRYHRFLDHYKNLTLYRYEDFIADPKAVLKEIANTLELSFDESFHEVFSVHQLSGDSGRKGSTISARPRHAVPQELNKDLEQSDTYVSLCGRLNYSAEGGVHG